MTIASCDCGFHLVIERLLISGSIAASRERLPALFPSRYRAASHFRFDANLRNLHAENKGFHLVIERLLISGPDVRFAGPAP